MTSPAQAPFDEIIEFLSLIMELVNFLWFYEFALQNFILNRTQTLIWKCVKTRAQLAGNLIRLRYNSHVYTHILDINATSFYPFTKINFKPLYAEFFITKSFNRIYKINYWKGSETGGLKLENWLFVCYRIKGTVMYNLQRGVILMLRVSQVNL